METLLTVEQYAERAQLHPDSVRRQLREGRLRAIKKGRVWRIPASVVYEDSRQAKRAGKWATAAASMADVYANSLKDGDELTAITTAEGEFYDSAIPSK
jgi:excisionase family DNA binding protein